MLFFKGGIFAVLAMTLVAAFVIFRTHLLHKKRESSLYTEEDEIPPPYQDIVSSSASTIGQLLVEIVKTYSNGINGIGSENLKILKKALKRTSDLNSRTKQLKDSLNMMVFSLKEGFIETGHHYVQVMDYLREIAHNLSFIIQPCYDHVNNNHKALIRAQVEELETIQTKIVSLHNEILVCIENSDFTPLAQIINKQGEVLDLIQSYKKNQIKRIKNLEVGTRNSMLYIQILTESKNLVLNSINLLKSQRDFVDYFKNHAKT